MNRLFVFGWILASLCALGINGARARPGGGDSPSSKGSSGGKVLLTPDDFTFAGSYLFSADNQAGYGMGLTSRRVRGELRFLTFSYTGKVKARLIEFALPEKVGDKITSLTATWDDVWSPLPYPNLGGGDEYGLWWEDMGDDKGRLWTTHCTDYPSDPKPAGSNTGVNNPFAVAIRTLNADGTIAQLKGEYGFAGVGQRAIYGGIQSIPKWFQDKYSVSQPYLAGWGGYTSRMAQGLVPSLGLMALAFPDVTTYETNTIIPTKDFKILADHRSGTTNYKDWYALGKPTQFDRGQRNADVINYFGGGDPRENPTTAPSEPPAKGGQWQSPAPDGFGRFVWGDSFYNTGCWIDGPNKGGFIAIGSFAKGKAYYAMSTLHNEGRHAELQIFNPDDFGKVVKGKLPPWKVQPAASKLLTPDLAPLGLLYPTGGNNPAGAAAGATFDTRTSTLYIWSHAKNHSVLIAYKVKC